MTVEPIDWYDDDPEPPNTGTALAAILVALVALAVIIYG